MDGGGCMRQTSCMTTLDSEAVTLGARDVDSARIRHYPWVPWTRESLGLVTTGIDTMHMNNYND